MDVLPNPPKKLDVLLEDEPLEKAGCLRKSYAPLVHTIQVNSALHECYNNNNNNNNVIYPGSSHHQRCYSVRPCQKKRKMLNLKG